MNKALSTLLVSAFLIVLGEGIYKKTVMAVAPPIYDPISYYSRSALVWGAISQGDFNGILNGPMDIRPPGTALVLYPFGFRISIHGFLFRSVFAPILIWAIAISIPIIRLVQSKSDSMLGGSVILGLITLPLFYHFEVNETLNEYYRVFNQWGMVDCLEGAIAALAVSLLRYGLWQRQLGWSGIGLSAGAFSFFIKPSGVIIMIALIGVATVEFLIQLLNNPGERKAIIKFAVQVYLTGFLVFALAIWMAFSSGYMNREVIAAAVKASQILISLKREQPLLSLLAMFIVPVVGWWWFLPGIFYALFLVVGIEKAIERRKLVFLRLLAASGIAVAGICWWLFLAGPQHRYLFPILLLIIAWLIPDVFDQLLSLRPISRRVVVTYCLFPAVLLSVMLWLKHPPVLLQKLMGVNLSAGGYGAEMEQGKWLLVEADKLGHPLNLYSIGNFGVGIIEMCSWVQSIEHANAPQKFVVRRPLNWVDPPGLRLEDLLQSDIILAENIPNADSNASRTVATWSEEIESFKRFAYRQKGADNNGLELISGGAVKLLRIADRRQFRAALLHWAKSITWTDDFLERNKDFMSAPKEALPVTNQ